MYSTTSSDYTSSSSTSAYALADSRGMSSSRPSRTSTTFSHTSFLDMSPEPRGLVTDTYPHRLPTQAPGENGQTVGRAQTWLDDTDTHRNREIPEGRNTQHCCGKIRSAFDTILSPMMSSIGEHLVYAVINHQLDEDQLYKLSSDPIRKKGRIAFDRDGRGYDVQGTSVEDYPNLQSLLDPLSTYFRILLASCGYIQEMQQLADGSHLYTSHLISFESKYEWPAVLAYHFDFHRNRLREMKQGVFSKWAEVDVGLHAQHLAGREKGYASTPSRLSLGLDSLVGMAPRSEAVCELFNRGACQFPCRYQRAHNCQNCGATGHGLVNCPSARVAVYSTHA